MRMRWVWVAAILGVAGCLGVRAQGAAADPLAALRFLEGSWSAHGTGPGGVMSDGSYTFARELGGHVLARHAVAAGCSGPAAFDCEHRDLLYVFEDGGGLKAIYFDNEGHVIHYSVATPEPAAVEFLSEGRGPRFRLAYTLRNGMMAGRFQMQAPGTADWRSYLEWTGTKK